MTPVERIDALWQKIADHQVDFKMLRDLAIFGLFFTCVCAWNHDIIWASILAFASVGATIMSCIEYRLFRQRTEEKNALLKEVLDGEDLKPCPDCQGTGRVTAETFKDEETP